MNRKHRPALAIAAVAAVSFGAAFLWLPDWDAWAGQAAFASAMLAMPEGSLALLEHRFADKLIPAPSKDEGDVAPYVEPWTEPEDPASSTGEPDSGEAVPQEQTSPGTKPASPAKVKELKIPEAYKGTLLQEDMAGRGGNYLPYGKGWLRNSTDTPDNQVLSIMNQGLNIQLEDTEKPQVLIVHTHATESYEPLDSAEFDTRNTWRSTNNRENMVAVGEALAKKLKDAGIGVIHDATQHDYPSYNGAYDRSAETVRKYLKQYPTIKIVLDVHRDAILRGDDMTVKPVVEINGKKAAQLMIITGCEDGSMNVPKWRENLRFAASLQDAIEQKYPRLTRPIFFCYRKYNMDLTTGSLLLEVGSNGNTLEESIYTAEMVGDALAGLLKPEDNTPDNSDKTQAPSGEDTSSSIPTGTRLTDGAGEE